MLLRTVKQKMKRERSGYAGERGKKEREIGRALPLFLHLHLK
jgi:hypothetical protein